MLIKNTYLETLSTCWNVTAVHIILKDKDDIDALCPTDSSPKYIVLPISRCKWQVLKIKILWKIWFFQLTLQHVFFQSVSFYSVSLRCCKGRKIFHCPTQSTVCLTFWKCIQINKAHRISPLYITKSFPHKEVSIAEKIVHDLITKIFVHLSDIFWLSVIAQPVDTNVNFAKCDCINSR